MHCFIDITEIYKSEAQKAKFHYQKVIMQNITHNLITPLNSIVSTNDICKVNIHKLKDSIISPTLETE